MSSKTPSVLHVSADESGTLILDLGAQRVIAPSRLVHVEIDRHRVERFVEPGIQRTDDRTVVSGRLDGTDLDATWTATLLGDDAWEFGLELTNAGTETVAVTRMDPLAAHLDGGRWSTLAFVSAWGDEWRPVTGTTDYHHRLSTRSGRSAHGMSPWFGLERDGAGVVVSPAWSGNWHIDLDEGTRVSAGISTWELIVELAPGESVSAPRVVLSVGSTRDAATRALTRAAGTIIPRSTASERLDVEWNHWWPYEDVEVTEEIIAENARIATDLGIRVVTVDAGWFGPADPGTYWGDYRGDWDLVNTARFPSGLAALGDSIRAAGARPGIWEEAEAVGSLARLRREHPELMALAVDGRRHDPSYGLSSQSLDPEDPTFLGYVCLGSPAAREFVLESMSRVVRETGAEWVKLDFNVDPDAGCTRTDHGHGAGDGLLRHYEGLYSVLDEFRERHPEVVLEACSSGGLRIDFGLARHVHCFFLSDPDFTEHALQVLWGASLLLPPVSILHWSWSQWRGDHPASQLDFAALSDEQFATTLRAAMLHRFGVSLRLPELRPSHLEVLRAHVALYTDTIADLVRDGELRRLSGQPQRGGFGERAPALQLSSGDRHVVAQYVLPGGSTPAVVRPELDPARDYRVTDLATGTELALGPDGIPLDDKNGTVTSWLLLVEVQ
ncbi:alpha-galactosidase [Schumannella luteola]